MQLKFFYYLEIGENCQIKTDETDSTSECSLKCANNATCTQDPENPGKTFCHCQPGFQGDRCELCNSNSVCQNGGQCATEVGRCNCVPGKALQI